MNIFSWSLWQAQLQEQLSQGEEAQASPDEAQFAQLQSEKVSLNLESWILWLMYDDADEETYSKFNENEQAS